MSRSPVSACSRWGQLQPGDFGTTLSEIGRLGAHILCQFRPVTPRPHLMEVSRRWRGQGFYGLTNGGRALTSIVGGLSATPSHVLAETSVSAHMWLIR